MSLDKVKKLKFEVQNRSKTISIFLQSTLGYIIYLELLESHYEYQDIYYHELYLKVANMSSRQTFQKFIDECIAENYVITKISKKDKRKVVLSLSYEVVNDFENVIDWNQLN